MARLSVFKNNREAWDMKIKPLGAFRGDLYVCVWGGGGVGLFYDFRNSDEPCSRLFEI
jgi:hypothetical protein